MPDLNDALTSLLKEKGTSLVGFADLREIDEEARNHLPFGISIAAVLNPEIIVSIVDGPNARYNKEYERLNQMLGILAADAAELLKGKGYHAESTAATNSGIDPGTLATRLPHKVTATRAGLGWIGKCALLVTPEYGSGIRLATVLTDAPLATGKSVDRSNCDDCTACVDACPGHAVTGRHWEPGVSRESLYDAFACRKTAQEFERSREGVHDNICGICIAVCPWTRRYLDRAF